MILSASELVKIVSDLKPDFHNAMMLNLASALGVSFPQLSLSNLNLDNLLSYSSQRFSGRPSSLCEFILANPSLFVSNKVELQP